MTVLGLCGLIILEEVRTITVGPSMRDMLEPQTMSNDLASHQIRYTATTNCLPNANSLTASHGKPTSVIAIVSFFFQNCNRSARRPTYKDGYLIAFGEIFCDSMTAFLNLASASGAPTLKRNCFQLESTQR